MLKKNKTENEFGIAKRYKIDTLMAVKKEI